MSQFTEALRCAHEGAYEPPFSFLFPNEIWTLCEKAKASPPGCFVEVGVFKGGSAYHLIDVAKAQNRDIYLYDTFAGMPYSDPSKGDSIPAGYHPSDIEEVKCALGPYPHVVKCVFPHTPHMPAPPVAFAHIDCDQYQAIVESCRALAPLMAPGGILWFDDVPVNGGLVGARNAVQDLYPSERILRDAGSDRWYVKF